MDSEVERLHSRAKSLVAKFKQGGGRSYIEEAIDLGRKALQLSLSGHPKRAVSLTSLALHLCDRYNQFGAASDFEEAIIFGREALHLCPPGHPDRLRSLNNLAVDLSTRYDQLGGMEDLEEAIALSREALDLHPQGHPNRSGANLNNLAVDLFTRYAQLGKTEDLNEPIALDREALDLRPQGHLDRSGSLNNLAVHLSKALDLLPQGHPDRSGSLSNLAIRLSNRYNQPGGVEDLNEAIVLDREGLELRPQGHPYRSMSLNNLALGEMEDLDEAIVLDREALYLCPQGHPDRSGSLNNLATRLSTRYSQLGGVEDLDEAIVLDREALDLRPQGHPNRSGSLNNLAVHLSTRYKQLGAVEDLDEAIVFDREALDLRPQGHPDRPMSLNNLVVNVSTRHNHLGRTEHLDEAIVLNRKALDLHQQGHPSQSMSLNNLVVNLSSRYLQLGRMEDLEEAIFLDREALDLRPQGHPDRSTSLHNLAVILSSRYDQLARVEDLDHAIALGREAVGLRSQRHPLRSDSLDNLARCLCSRFTHARQLKDKEEVFSLYTQLAPSMDPYGSTFPPFHRTSRIRNLFSITYSISGHSAVVTSILKNFTSSLAVDAFSACLRERAPAHAVELLEQGRGVFWTQLTRLRSPLDDLVISGPAGETLAKEFTQLALLIRNTINSPGANQHERLCHLNLKMERVVTDARELPGLSRFLLPPFFADLQCAASGGPIIIMNASKYSCDALIVLLDRDPAHIPLRITQEGVRDLSTDFHALTMRATKLDVARELGAFLRILWDQIVSPIVDFLQTTPPSQSRIWWCPTAEFSALPLHAAGPCRRGQENLADIYISSYTPTLAALIRARRRDPLSSVTRRKHFIAIGQAKAVGENELVSVGAELDNIGQLVAGLATFTRIDGAESCASRVVEELGKNDWVHLACHGLPNRKKPFESAFALRDGHFTIQRIIGCDLKNPEFAYLSACHTTVGDEESPDEVIHLASAMQFAGFHSVIGTMWAVDDGETNKITSTFYKHMVDESGRLDHTRAVFALNRTMNSVRVPFDQRILYIHLGA
ncbi:CHAT domain-containing protein [Boletus coccyginus]|nr:CHAT domain-containing protein [Boletus coccyginus]